MYKHILIPIALDHDRKSSEAVNLAEMLKGDGARITAVSVVEQVPAYITQAMPRGQMEKNLEDAKVALKAELSGALGIETDVIFGRPGASIVDYANAHDIDLIIVGSHRPGLQDYFLGSTAARVVRHAPCSVLVVR